MIKLHDISKAYGTKVAVSQVTLEVKTGEIVGFLGVNGAGKTTTMRMITGVIAPTSGKVTVDGHDPVSDHTIVARKIGYLPENNPLYPDMLVSEYLEYISAVKRSHTHYHAIAASVGLVDVLDRKIETLSRGYKQRVGLAAALIGDAPILLLDEPTSGLDPIEQERIRGLIATLAQHKIIVFSTHILSEVEEVATRIIMIDRGTIVYDGPKPEGVGAVERLFKDKVLRNESSHTSSTITV